MASYSEKNLAKSVDKINRIKQYIADRHRIPPFNDDVWAMDHLMAEADSLIEMIGDLESRVSLLQYENTGKEERIYALEVELHHEIESRQ
jgi:hypothetical protein